MLNVARIDDTLKRLACNDRFRINAHQVAYLSGNVNVTEVYKYLNSREPYILEKSYELLCPDRMDSTATFKSLEEIPKGWVECRVCGSEFIPDPKLINIVFDFTDDYIRQVKEEAECKKKEMNLLVTSH